MSLAVELEYRAGSLGLRARFGLRLTDGEDRGALFGPSGSGKTTLLRILAGLVVPDRGTVRLDGRVLTDKEHGVQVAPGQRQIGLVTQSPALFPHLTVEQNLRFGLRELPEAEQRRRVEELAELLGLALLRSRLPERLSGGERQRVALGRALAPEPRLLLLDEPFSALDMESKAALWAVLDQYLRARGIGTLLVSHDAGEVWARAQTVIRMEGGVAMQQGPPSGMLRRERERALEQLQAHAGGSRVGE